MMAKCGDEVKRKLGHRGTGKDQNSTADEHASTWIAARLAANVTRYVRIARREERKPVHRRAPRLEREVGARELKTVEVADYAGGYSGGFEEFAGDLLDLLGGYGFQHGDQLGDREVAVKVHVVAG